MGTYRSNYPMISEANRNTSVPHFAWFHPGNYMAAMRTGNQHHPEEITLIPNRSIQPDPTENPTKNPKTSRKNPNDNPDTPTEPKPKKSRKGTRKNSSSSSRLPNCESSMDSEGTLSPFCSCTGTPRQCYRWGAGGWQSACCTINISEFPLPMSETRPGSRTAGRKMSHGAFVKLLQRLSSEGFDLGNAIDLKDHWARHGTNKFVIIK